jgi:hypothetical protein
LTYWEVSFLGHVPMMINGIMSLTCLFLWIEHQSSLGESVGRKGTNSNVVQALCGPNVVNTGDRVLWVRGDNKKVVL